MPQFRADLERIARYVPGRGEREIMREFGMERVVKLASNECPYAPFPEVVQAVAEAAAGINRYPDTTYHDLTDAIGMYVGVDPAAILVGGGGTELLMAAAMAVGGPSTTAVYATPSFVMYRISTAVSGARPIEIPLDEAQRHDLDEMASALQPDTTVVYICNPNNPTGTHVSGAALRRFVAQVPESVLIVVDEAYREFVDAHDYESLADHAPTAPNLVVLRTFSKVFGLAGLRIGYLVGNPEVLASVRRTQLPFTVTDLAQVAAVEALRHKDRLKERVEQNAIGRARLVAEFSSRGLATADSQTNFVFVDPGVDPAAFADAMLRRGVIVRPTGTPWVRVTVGTDREIDTFLGALDGALQDMR